MTETNDWARDVLSFWFGELTPKDWFEVSKTTDETIRRRFGGLHARMRMGAPREAEQEPRSALAAIVLFDQFPRNMFRRTAEAFATDSLAVELARNAVDRGFDEAMSDQERQFLYMPFMHSEIVADQERAVALFQALGNEDAAKYAIEHRDIIARFGRFPHRNRVLGRTDTAEELAFLEGHSGYGQ